MLTVMNRQLRRAQAKLDEKAEREKQKKKQARKDKLNTIRERRKERRIAGVKQSAPAPSGPVNVSSLTPEQRKRMPGRFSGGFMIATVFFIILQGATPPPDDQKVQGAFVGAGFFLMFGYFSTLFLLRRGNDKAFGFTITSGLALAVGLLFTRLIGPAAGTMDLWFLVMVGVGAAGVVLGAYLGRSVFNAGLRR